MKKINRHDLIYLCLILIISLISLYISDNKNVIPIYGILSILLIFVTIIIWILKYKKINTPMFYFLLISYISWFGNIVLKAFEIDVAGKNAIDNFNDEMLVNKSILFSIIGYSAMAVGAFLVTDKRKIENNYETIQNENLRKSIIIVAVLMIAVGMPQYCMNLINNIRTAFEGAYMDIYKTSNDGNAIQNIMQSFNMFFVPGLIFLVIACKDNKKIVNISIGIVLLNLILAFISGARGGAIALLLTLFYLYTTQIKKIKVRNYIVLGILAIIVMRLFNVVAVFRDEPDKNIDTLVKSFEETNDSGLILSTVEDLGASIFSLYHTINIVPSSQGYAYGYTYFASVMAVIPSLFMGGISFSNEASLAEWLMKKLNLDYGPGYTILAEAYYNFGMFGFLAMFAIGMLFSQIFEVKNLESNDKKILHSAIVTIAMYICLLTFRGTMLLIFRNYFYTIVIPVIAINIIKNTLDRKKIE